MFKPKLIFPLHDEPGQLGTFIPLRGSKVGVRFTFQGNHLEILYPQLPADLKLQAESKIRDNLQKDWLTLNM